MKQQRPEVETSRPSYQPSRAELSEDLRMGSTWEDFEKAAKARYIKRPRK